MRDVIYGRPRENIIHRIRIILPSYRLLQFSSVSGINEHTFIASVYNHIRACLATMLGGVGGGGGWGKFRHFCVTSFMDGPERISNTRSLRIHDPLSPHLSMCQCGDKPLCMYLTDVHAPIQSQ